MSEVSIKDNGGAASVSIRPAQPQPQQSNASENVRIERAEDRRMSISAEELAPQRAGLLASVKTRDGRVPNGRLTPEMCVYPDGRIPVPLRQAEAWGLVRRNAQTGEYEEIDQAPRQAAEQQQQREGQAEAEAEASFPAPVDTDAAAESQGFLSDLHRAMTASGVAADGAIIRAFTHPEEFRRSVLPKLVAQGGDSEAVWQGIVASFEDTMGRVASLCAAEGVNADSFFDYLESGQISRSRWLAAGVQALGGEARPFRALIREFKAIGVYQTRGVEVSRGPRRPGE